MISKMIRLWIFTLCLALPSWAAIAEEDPSLTSKWQAIWTAIETKDTRVALQGIQDFSDVSYLSQHKHAQEVRGVIIEKNTLLTYSFIQKAWEIAQALINRGVDVTVERLLKGDTHSPLFVFSEYAPRPFEGDALMQISKTLLDKNEWKDGYGDSFLAFFLKPELFIDDCGFNHTYRSSIEIQNIRTLMGSDAIYLHHLFSGRRLPVLKFQSKQEPEILFDAYKKSLQKTSGAYNKQGMLGFALNRDLLEFVKADEPRFFKDFWTNKEKEFLLAHYPASSDSLPPAPLLNNSLSGFPSDELWRLFVDGLHQKKTFEKGWKCYEAREAGCIGGMVHALGVALQEKGPLSVSLYKEIQKQCLSPTTLRTGESSATHILLQTTLSLKGLFELRAQEEAGWIELSILLYGSENPTYVIHHSRNLKNSSTEETIQTIIDSYNTTISQVASDKDKLKTIIKMVSELDRFHFFQDGNGRTATIVAQRELIRQGFSPVVLEDPNRLDGFSQEELFEEFVKGMENFDFIKRNKAYPGAPEGLDTQTLLRTVDASKSGFFQTEIPQFWKILELPPPL